jgi:Region in Clathrin and VPS
MGSYKARRKAQEQARRGCRRAWWWRPRPFRRDLSNCLVTDGALPLTAPPPRPQVLEGRVDHSRIVTLVRRGGHLAVVKPYLLSVQKNNLPAVNEAVNEICIAEDNPAELEASVEGYDNFDQLKLAGDLEVRVLRAACCALRAACCARLVAAVGQARTQMALRLVTSGGALLFVRRSKQARRGVPCVRAHCCVSTGTAGARQAAEWCAPCVCRRTG